MCTATLSTPSQDTDHDPTEPDCHARMAGPRPGLRLLVGPLTTALMVSARADPAIEALPEGASQGALALAMAKAVARRAVLDWQGAMMLAILCPYHPRASTPCWKSGPSSRRSRPRMSPRV